MTERALRPGNVASATLLIGGVLLVAMPRHALSIVQLVIATVAASTALFALVVNAPPAWWTSPFDRTRQRAATAGGGSDEVDRIRARLAGRRLPVERGPALPPETLRLLQELIEVGLERDGPGRPGAYGPEPTGPAKSGESAGAVLSPRTWAVLAWNPDERPPWFRMKRPDERAVADAVHRVLDDLDRLAAGGPAARPRIPSLDTRAP